MIYNHKWNVNINPLIAGFVSSVVLILISYFLVVENSLRGWPLALVILGICSFQAIIQLVCFMHLGIESKPHWNLITFLFLVLVVPPLDPFKV